MKIRSFLMMALVALLVVGCAVPMQWTTVPQTQVDPVPSELIVEPVVDAARTDLAGRWQGAISVMGTELEIIVNFSGEDDALAGTIDIPQQNAFGIPLHSIRFDAPSVHFEMLEGLGSAAFDGELDAGVITGVFRQSGIEATFELVAVDAEPVAAPPVDASQIYADPSGLFTVPIPTNWTVEASEGYGILASPDDGILVYVLTVPAESALAGIEAAWEIIDPDFDLEPQQTQQAPPSRPGLEETFVVVYRTGDPDRLVIAGADLLEGVAYVQIVDAELAAFQQRMSQIQIIGTGWVFTQLDQEDLTGVEPLPLSEELLAELEAYIVEKMEQMEVPAAVVSIVRDGEIVFAQGFGVHGPEDDRPVTPETHFMIGSTGKTMTTMLMAALVDAGLLDWDTPVVEILPQFSVADPELTQTLTVRNLVCACTGVPRRDLELVFNAFEQEAEDVVEELATYEFFTDFGEAFQYSNQMVATGGYMAGAADGGEWGNLFDAYVQSLQERILEPIGMENTTLSFEEVVARGDYAVPYGQNVMGELYPIPLDVEKFLMPIAPAGAHWSTSLDMARYLITQLNRGVAPDGTRVVSEENLAETWEPQIAITADASYGLGWIVDDYKGLLMLQHSGNTFGFTSDLAFLPDAGIGVSVLTNGRVTNLFNEAVRTRLWEMLYDQEPLIDTQIDFALESMRSSYESIARDLGEVDAAEVEPFLGRYTNPALGEITLSLAEDRLLFDAGEFAATLRPYEGEDARESQYLMVDMALAGLGIRLVTDAAGDPIVVLGAGAIEYTFTPIE
ncbi:MAG: serine hydrolase [Caldilineaceae bacterium]|nr:serine hydrolase [Caldilineaceae bacterium]